ncbi:protein KIBRA [Crotalus adamanteus]|uniref:Protein KIBRA n=1 Tax=Crotalus adamanteus TaxID=8729 RepID=A0AAW1C324_CROAD
MPRQELPLPKGWEEARNYDIDHATKTTSWVDPQESRWVRLFGLSLPRWPPACPLQVERAWGRLYEGRPAAKLREVPVAAGVF